MSIKEIIKSWAIAMMPTEEQQIKASERYEICNNCDEKGLKLDIEYCKQCGCPLKGKIFSQYDGCPLNKW